MIPEDLQALLSRHEAALTGVADLSSLPEGPRDGLPYGILIAMSYTRQAIMENLRDELHRYYQEYGSLNQRLEEASQALAKHLQSMGYRADTKKPTEAPSLKTQLRTPLPHKTVATLAGVGWIGRCALLVTRAYGSAIRIAVVLTDRPLTPDAPVEASSCPAGCKACVEICPGKAPKGPVWHPGMERELFYDAYACREAARDRADALLQLPERTTICGLCIAVCPFTRAAYHF